MNQAGYSIKDLEVLSGIKMHTIRIWEKRYGLLAPHRTETNIRWYDDNDLRRLLNVSMLIKNGYKISKVAEWDNDMLRSEILRITDNKKSAPEYIDRFVLLIAEMNTSGFEHLLNEVLQQYDLEEAFTHIFFALFQKIGIYWQVGTIFPAQEHFVTSLFRQKLIAAIDALQPQPRRKATMLFFTHENEWHEMGLLFYSYLAKKSGLTVFYLGQSVPFSDLEKISTSAVVDFVFTTFVNSISPAELNDYLARLKHCFSKQKIFVSGKQVHELQPNLPRNVKTVKDYREFRKYIGTPA